MKSDPFGPSYFSEALHKTKLPEMYSFSVVFNSRSNENEVCVAVLYKICCFKILTS